MSEKSKNDLEKLELRISILENEYSGIHNMFERIENTTKIIETLLIELSSTIDSSSEKMIFLDSIFSQIEKLEMQNKVSVNYLKKVVNGFSNYVDSM